MGTFLSSHARASLDPDIVAQTQDTRAYALGGLSQREGPVRVRVLDRAHSSLAKSRVETDRLEIESETRSSA